MRSSLAGVLVLFLSSGASALRAQSMLETAAAAAGGSAGGIAGKKVSDALTTVLGKVDKHTAKAAKDVDGAKARRSVPDAPSPVMEVGPGVPKADGSNVPPPPPIRGAVVHKAARVADRRAPVIEAAPLAPPLPAPPAPEMTADDLKRVTAGMEREDVLKLGAPSARITMFDEGHLVEVYRYEGKVAMLGVVRLTDGAVSNVAIR